MKAFIKTLVGDTANMAVVAALVAVAAALVHIGQGAAAAFVLPVLALGGTAWLATR